MSGIHDKIIQHLATALTEALITNIDEDDPTRVGVVIAGPLQGDPMDPDDARITVTIYENDPDQFVKAEPTGFDTQWADELYEEEVGGVQTMKRRFTLKTRALLEETAETLGETQALASDLRERIEATLHNLSFAGIATDREYVASRVRNMRGEMKQSGGPDAYDYFIKIRFEILTTTAPGA